MRREAAEVAALFDAGLAVHAALGFEPDERARPRQLLGIGQAIELIEGVTAAQFEPTVVYVDSDMGPASS